jgi:hypothetical protein
MHHQAMDWNQIDWRALERLRANFLHGGADSGDYWRAESDLASYVATFAQRIGWKWDYVLAEVSRRGWSPARGELLDWGCGSGIAGRAFLDHFGAESVTTLRVWDRSTLAMQFAARRAREKYPGLNVELGLGAFSVSAETLERQPSRPCETDNASQPAALETGVPPVTLLLSHVVNELTPGQIEALSRLIGRAQTVLWVEPGTYEVSRMLIATRERLRPQFNLIAPCTHQEHCGLLAAGNERHWCHHFASPPPDAFQDRHWSRFASLLGIDLRDLALSFLVLDRRPVPPLPTGAARILGHPRIYKAHALLLSCDETGVRERKLTKRALPEDFKRLKKGGGDALRIMKCEDEEVVSLRPFPSA